MNRFKKVDFSREYYNELPGKEKDDYLRKAAKRANKRMLDLERAKLDRSSAHKIIFDYLRETGRKRLPERAPKTAKERKDLIHVLDHFLNAKTSLVSEARIYRDNRDANLAARGIYDVDKFADFVNSGAYKELKKTYYEGTLFDIYAEYESEFDVEEMLELFDRLTEADVALDVVHASIADSIRAERI